MFRCAPLLRFLRKEVVVQGTGSQVARKGHFATVNYTGYLENGRIFDSSVRRNRPYIFSVGIGQVIRALDEGVQSMVEGEQSVFYCSSDYGFGVGGIPGSVPPGASLKLEVHLMRLDTMAVEPWVDEQMQIEAQGPAAGKQQQQPKL
eukprot:Sspe_Gene.84339::Locus_55357_Transcript_1_1_Confidence_1.000_Length_483::g.84339::m.84339/K09568/FKBP1; FK506-binding protein 1